MMFACIGYHTQGPTLPAIDVVHHQKLDYFETVNINGWQDIQYAISFLNYICANIVKPSH